jgi:hypothetical protein
MTASPHGLRSTQFAPDLAIDVANDALVAGGRAGNNKSAVTEQQAQMIAVGVLDIFYARYVA